MNRKSFSLLILALLLTSLLNAVTLTRSISNEDQLKDDVEKKSSMEHGVGETFEGSDTGLDKSWDPRKDPNIGGETHEDTRARAQGQRSDQPYAGVNTQDSKIRLVVGFRSESEDALKELKETAARHRGEVVNTVSMGREVRAAAVELSWTSATAFMEETWLAEWTSYVEPAMKFEAQMVPNDPYWSLQWGPQKIEADWAWNVTVGDPSVLVAVVDSGVDYTHEDLALNYMPGGYDWVNMDNDPMDDFGHGTHCAGIIAAELDNLVGIAGLAQVRVIAEKVLNSYGGGYEDWVANGIINATDIGADIISMSLGGYGDSVLIHDAVKYANDAGVLVIAAAGNDDTNMKLYPAGYDEVVAVAATDQIDNKAYFSNWGEWIELAAPGVDIHSTIPGGYASKGGTSMACPHVAGLAALVWSRHPNKTRDWVRLWMRYTADDLGETGHDIIYGYGRINARKAVAESPPAHELIAVDWTTPPYVEPGGSGSVNVTILNFGESNETNITVELLANNTPADSLVIGFLASGNSATANLLWNPSADGLYNLTLSVEPVPGESNLENNILWKFVYVGFPVKAVVLHSAGNLYSDIISTWQALNSEWHLFGDTMVYIDYVSLNIEDITYEDINETDADVLIISCASDPYSGWEFTDSEVEAIEQYVHEGHGLIATAGTFYYYVPNNNKLAPLFGICDTEYWGTAYTDLLHLEDALHPVLIDVPDPFVFPQVGGALPEDGEWSSDELVGGEYIARGHYRESAIVTYRGLVYISPWLEIQPPYYHHHMQLLYNALTWSSYKKPDHELIAGLETPKFLEPGESTLLNATVYNRGLNNETDVELFLLIDGVAVNATIISNLLTDASHTISYWWTPTVEATYNVTAYALPVPDEEYISNNVKSVNVPVTHIAVALFKNIDPWDDPSNEVALSLYNIPYVVFSSSDIGSIDLNAFSKVVIASDQDQDFYDAMYIYRWWFEDYVSMGGVLEIHAADWGWHGGGWIAPLPGGLQWVSYSANYVTLVDPTHPVATTPNMITDSELDGWGASVHGYFNTYPADSRIVIVEDSTGMPAYLEFGYGAGFILASSQTLEFAYIRGYSRILENSLLYIPMRPEHDLAVVLEAPTFLEPGDSSLLNATVYNRGLSNETDVELFLFIDEAEVESVVIPELLNGSSYTLSHQWTPTLEGTYNITAYAPPVPDEEYPANNKWTKIIDVRPIRGLILFDQTHYTDNIENYETWVENLTDYGYIVETHISGPITFEILEDYCAFVIPQAQDYYQPAELTAIQDYVLLGGGLVVIGDDAPSIYTELTSFAGITWTSGGYSGYTSDITPHPVTEDVNTAYFDSPVSEMQVASPAVDLIRDNQGGIMLAASEISAGKVIGIADEHSIRDGYIYSADNLLLARNMIDWTCAPPLEHELVVYLEAPNYIEPGESTLLNATVRNRGLNNETNVELHLTIDSTTVNSTHLPQLLTEGSYTINYLWTPTVEATYNVTAYAPPVPSENITANNLVTRIVPVHYVSVALISDYSELSVVTPILDSMGMGYDVYNDNRIHLYTEDLNLLLSYEAVIFYTDYRHITSNEHTTLESYLLSGGSLLVTGFDSLVSDDLLRDIIRSSTMGDNVGEPDLYVVDETHPIISGPYGSFPVGYHISGLSSDCDAIEADTARMAVTVAELADGYDKIIATDGLPGKVVYWNGVGPDDWMWNVDCEAIFKNTLVWFLIQLEHELAVVLDAPTFLEPGDSSLLNATVYNRGLSNETDVELFLLIDEAEVESVVIPELLNGSSYTLSHQWTPTLEGTYNITAYAPPVPDEEYPANNKWTKIIDVRPIRGLILFDQTHWTDNIENYETWVENLTDYGYIVETHISGPITLDTLEDYCAFVIPQAQDYYQPAELTAIQDYVLLGGGLVVIGDDAPSIYTELTSFAGITWTSGGYSGYTSDITPHPVTEDVNTAYFGGPVSEMQVASPAVDLIRDNQGGIMLAASEISAGKVIGIADEDSIDDGEIYLADNLCLARNMIDWTCVPPPEHELAVDLEAPPFLTPGDSSLLRATVQNSGLSNETNVDLLMFIDGTTVNSTTISELPTGESYTISYLWTPTVEATYNVTAYAPPVPGEDVTANNVVMKDVLVSSITGTYVSVTPTMTSVSIGESFTVSVDIVNVTSLYGFDVLLNWDPTMLEYESHETTVPVEDHPGGVLHEPVFVVKDEANQTQAACWVVYSSMAPAPSFSGSGTVFEITFRTLKVGTTPLEIIGSDLASDTIPPGSIPHYVINGVVQVTESTPGLHDVAILNVTTSRNATYPGHAVNITVTVANMGNSLEDFNVTVYYGNTPIETQSIAHLPPPPNPHQPPTPNSIEILTFTWNTTGLEPCNNHTIWAEVHPVPHEANTTNNIYHDGVVKIKLLGDLDGNDVVDILDVVTAAHAYRARRGEPRWNQEADLAPLYGVIDIYDIVTIVYIFSSCP